MAEPIHNLFANETAIHGDNQNHPRERKTRHRDR